MEEILCELKEILRDFSEESWSWYSCPRCGREGEDADKAEKEWKLQKRLEVVVERLEKLV